MKIVSLFISIFVLIALMNLPLTKIITILSRDIAELLYHINMVELDICCEQIGM